MPVLILCGHFQVVLLLSHRNCSHYLKISGYAPGSLLQYGAWSVCPSNSHVLHSCLHSRPPLYGSSALRYPSLRSFISGPHVTSESLLIGQERSRYKVATTSSNPWSYVYSITISRGPRSTKNPSRTRHTTLLPELIIGRMIT